MRLLPTSLCSSKSLLSIFTLLSMLGAAACDTAGGGDDDDEEGDESGDDRGSGEVCVNEACDDEEEGSGSNNNGQACPDVAELTTNPTYSGGPQMCSGYSPGECNVLQDGCSVQISCSQFGTMTVDIDENGVSEDVQVPLGDGITATCHAELDDPYAWIILVCTAQGVTCEFAESSQ
jgi:hypothetical protein